jgi:hypothetical protein
VIGGVGLGLSRVCCDGYGLSEGSFTRGSFRDEGDCVCGRFRIDSDAQAGLAAPLNFTAGALWVSALAFIFPTRGV